MTNRKVCSLIGFAAKAGKAAKGAAACEAAVKSGKARLVILDSAASDNTKKAFRDACSHYGVQWMILEENGLLGHCLGKPSIKVTGITDAGFARSIIKEHGIHSGGETN